MHPFPTSETGPKAQPEDQAPLGPEPSYDEVLDVAVQYTFPCSDPIAVDGGQRHPEREEGQPKGPGRTAGHGENVLPEAG